MKVIKLTPDEVKKYVCNWLEEHGDIEVGTDKKDIHFSWDGQFYRIGIFEKKDKG